jgi:glycosyltransferase involved in cell wall biosynthesis
VGEGSASRDEEKEESIMNISHAIGHLRLGAGRYVVDTAVHQARCYGHSVNVLVSTDVDGNWRTDPALIEELKSHGIATSVTGDFFHRNLAGLRAAAAEMSLRRDSTCPWLVHAHTAMAAAAARWAGADAVVATCHGWDESRPEAFRLQDALAFRLCDAITSPSAFWAHKIELELGVLAPDVIPVGLDLARYPARNDESRGFLPPTIVTVCELTPRKGVDLLIRAMPLVWRRCEAAELHIIGDGDAAADLRGLAVQIDPSSRRVCFHGSMKHPYPELCRYGIFALASRSDNLPVALIEAMLARLPVVATEVGGIPEITGGGRYGVLVPPDSPDAMAAGLLGLLAAPGQALDTARSGEEFARERFSVDTAAGSLEQVYRAVLASARRGPYLWNPVFGLEPGCATPF